MKDVTWRELWVLAIPAAASMFLNNSFRVIDQFAVQWLGVAAQAAVGACTFVAIAMVALFSLVSAGTGPLVARAVGAEDEVLIRRVIGNSLTGSVGVGAVVLVAVGLGAGQISGMVGLSGETAVQATTYLRWLAAAGIPLALAPMVDAAFIAMGRTGLVMMLKLVGTGLNAVLNPLLIYSLDLGIGGAALATGISQLVIVVIGLSILWRETRPEVQDLRLDDTFGRIIRVGMPITSNTLLYALVYWALLHVAISPLGPAVNAALGIGFSALESFTWPVFWGFSMAVASLVGRHLGAGRPEQAEKAARMAAPVLGGLGLVSSLVFWFGAESVCGLFTEDPEVLVEAVQYAQILAFSQLFVALEALAEGVLAGAGDTRAVLWWSAPINLARVPLGWWVALPLGFGAAGIWWVINITTIIKAIGKGWSVVRGRWTTLEI